MRLQRLLLLVLHENLSFVVGEPKKEDEGDIAWESTLIKVHSIEVVTV